MKKILSIFVYYLKSIVNVILAAGVIFLLSWSLCFNFGVTYVGITFFIILFLKYRHLLFSIKSLLLYLGIYLLFLPFTLQQYQTNTALMFQKIQAGKKLTIKEKLSIYGLNLVIASLAYPIYPEISKETFLMALPPNSEGIRYFESSFFLTSEKVKQAIRSGASRVYWSAAKDYALGSKEARYALALNPCTLSVRRINDKTIYLATVPIKYPKKANVTLLRYPIRVTLEEGLFTYLQDEGWLHPYHAVWQSE